jgi:Zn-finger nucleic acid-binding protein
MTGHSVLCPQCGGPLPVHAARQTVTCPFCHVAVAPPPEVIERVVDRVIVQKAEGDSGSLHCTRCATALMQVTSNGIVLSGCRGCGGLWLDNAAVERLMKVRDEDLERQAARMVGIFAGLPADVRHAAIACPLCASPLRRVEVPDTIHSVDVCDAHGTWFDHGELPMFISVFATRRAGELSDEDLRAAGVPGRGDSAVDGESGFFTDLFHSLKSLI